jgi:hypothetical protein
LNKIKANKASQKVLNVGFWGAGAVDYWSVEKEDINASAATPTC